MQVDLPLVVHKRRKCERLASGAATEVEHSVARPRIDSHGQQLRRLVLYLEQAFLVLLHGEQVPLRLLQELDAVRCELRELHVPLVLLKCRKQLHIYNECALPHPCRT